MNFLILLSATAFSATTQASDISPQKSDQIISDIPRAQAENSSSDIFLQNNYTASVKKPVSPKELLENIQFSLKNNLLINENFYSIENFEKFLEGKANIKTIPTKNGDTKITGIVSNLGNVLLNTKELRAISIDFEFQKNNTGTGKIFVRVMLPGTYADPNLTVDLVKSIFSENTEIKISDSPDILSKAEIANRMRSTRPGEPAPFLGYGAPATAELGNKRIEFIFHESITKTSLVLITFSAGQIKNIIITQSKESL